MKKSNHFRLLALTLVFSLLFSSQSAMAAELPKGVSNNSSEMTPLEETEFTREEAMELLGVSAEDAEEMSFYVVDAEPAETSSYKPGISTYGVGIEPGEAHTFPTFTFSGRNVGAYWTCKGTKFIWAAIHHSASDPNANIDIFLYGYGRENPNDIFDGCTDHVLQLGVGETHRHDSFISSPKNYDYHFVYYGGRQSTVTMIVGVV